MWRQLMIDTLVRPREAARQVLGAGIEQGALLEGAIGVTCAGVVLAYIAARTTPGGIDAVSAVLLGNPLLGAAVELAALGVIAFLTDRIGRLFGGTGGFYGALTLVVWLNAMMVLLQTGQLVALALLPPLAVVLALAALLWGLWAFANFVAELHGFQNPAMVLGGVVLTAVVLFFAAGMLLAMLGITPQEVS